MNRLLWFWPILIALCSSLSWAQQAADQNVGLPAESNEAPPRADDRDASAKAEPARSAQPADAAAAVGSPATGGAEPALEGRPIATGFVILGGRYIPPPYVVGCRGSHLYINGHVVPTAQLRQGTSGIRIQRREDTLATVVARVERQLLRHGVLIQLDGQTVALLPYNEGMRILDVLMSDSEPSQVKFEALMLGNVEWINSAQWLALMEKFQPSAELIERAGDWQEEAFAVAPRPTGKAGQPSQSLIYGVTLAGLVLAVLALGTLVSYRPQGNARWSEMDRSRDAIRLVVRCVFLLVVLNLLDLGCTLLAISSEGFWELNPLGTHMVGNPAGLVSLKIGTVLVSSSILLSLRCYRGAQVAAWWLCLLCTVVTFRWVMFNSLFL